MNMMVIFWRPATPSRFQDSRREEKAEERRAEKREYASFSVFFSFFKVDTIVSLPIKLEHSAFIVLYHYQYRPVKGKKAGGREARTL
jgi:hypothetical protein